MCCAHWEVAQINSSGESVSTEGLMEGENSPQSPSPTHVTLLEVWEAQNNEPSLKIVKEVLENKVSYSMKQEQEYC